ncbi:TPA: SHOCT domain-containing protein, partial [Clostridioides difficile]|nr:SHOCT domain-containing protein [Clostridioides difficile]
APKILRKLDIEKTISSTKKNNELQKIFNTTNNIENYIEFDEDNKKWFVSKKSINDKKTPIIHSYEDIVEFELLENGETVTKGGIGRALAGGILFGEAGAIVGGITGKKTTRKVVDTFKIKITINNIDNPIEYIELINKKTKTNSSAYEKAYKDAHKILSILSAITQSIKETDNINTKSVADEILKYKNLLDMEAITQDEFNTKKKELLNL